MDTGVETPPPPQMPKVAKVGHKKSRLGCQRCKTRRVKCDEQKPICGSCKRHGAECVYVDIKPNLSPHDSSEGTALRRRASRISVRSQKSPSPTAELFPRQLTEKEDPEIPESKARRIMELRLMQNSLLKLSFSTQTPDNDEWRQLWTWKIPSLSLENDNVLYAMYALSATNLLRENFSDEALYSARQNYFVLALREQRKECADINSSNAEAVCLTSILILHTSFAMIQERPLEQLQNYSPPIEWLKMGRGAGAVMWKANAATSPEIPVIFTMFMNGYQDVLSQQSSISLDQPFATVYTTITELSTDHTVCDAYRRTLAYIGSMQRAIDNNESQFVVCRKLQAFPMVVPSRFIDQVEALDLGALVILAHYFAIASQIDSEFWWLRGFKEDRTAVREIGAINKHVKGVCPSLMIWPLMKAKVKG